MTLSEFLDQNGAAIVIAAIASIPGTIAAIGTIINGQRGLVTRGIVQQSRDVSIEGVAVSTRNEVAIQGIKHDFRNGLGDHLADRAAEKTVEKMKPELEAASAVITDQVSTQVAQTAEKVAAVLADRTQTRDDAERRVGPVDRRNKGSSE